MNTQTTGGDIKQALVAQVKLGLKTAIDPCSVAAGTPMNLVEMGLVDDVTVNDDGEIAISLSLTSPSCMMLGQIMEQIDAVVTPLNGGKRPYIGFDDGLTWTPDRITGEARVRRETRRKVIIEMAAVRRRENDGEQQR